MTAQKLDTLLIGGSIYYMNPSPEISIDDKRFKYSSGTLTLSTDLYRGSLCAWHLEDGILKLKSILEGNYQTLEANIVADWFTSRVYLSTSGSNFIEKGSPWINFEDGHATLVSGLDNADSLSKKYTIKDISEYADITENEVKQCLVELGFIRRDPSSENMIITENGAKLNKAGWFHIVLLKIDDFLTKRELSHRKADSISKAPQATVAEGGNLNPQDKQSKLCKSCGIEKSTSEFWKSSRQKDGYTAWCRSCHSR